jgi:hypothetical protein
MNYTKHDKSKIISILDDLSIGKNKSELSKKYGVPRATIQYWERVGIPKSSDDNTDYVESNIKENSKLYSYILGLYLGDGYIDKIKDKNLYKIRISQDVKYEKLVELIRFSIGKFFGGSCFSIKEKGCCQITLYKKNLNLYFPQHSRGYKHLREIKLTPFQETWINKIELMRGLFHSDGSFYKSRRGKYVYDNYNFTNKSTDILNMFGDCLDSIGVSYGVRVKQNGIWVIQVQRKKDVEMLKQVLGDKINPFLG